MYIVAVGDDALKKEMLLPGLAGNTHIKWIGDIDEFEKYSNADAFIDLQFIFNSDRIEALKKLLPRPVFINSHIHTLKELGCPFIRINAWPTFLKRQVIEAASTNDETKSAALTVFTALQRKTEWVPDEPGFISARVVAMIINEAYFAFEEKVSTKEEIDTAMKLGTNYPYGPFEWSEKIGLKKIHELLSVLAKSNSRYLPAGQLKKEALEKWV